VSRPNELIGDMHSFPWPRPTDCLVDVDQDIDCITSGRTALSVLRAIPLFMGRECAACHLEFPGRWAWTMVWCPRDRRYLCQRCYKDVCKPVHVEQPALSKAYRIAGM